MSNIVYSVQQSLYTYTLSDTNYTSSFSTDNGAHGTNCTSNSCTPNSLYIMEVMELTVHLAQCIFELNETNCTPSSLCIMEFMELTVHLAQCIMELMELTVHLTPVHLALYT